MIIANSALAEMYNHWTGLEWTEFVFKSTMFLMVQVYVMSLSENLTLSAIQKNITKFGLISY